MHVMPQWTGQGAEELRGAAERNWHTALAGCVAWKLAWMYLMPIQRFQWRSRRTA